MDPLQPEKIPIVLKITSLSSNKYRWLSRKRAPYSFKET